MMRGKGGCSRQWWLVGQLEAPAWALLSLGQLEMAWWELPGLGSGSLPELRGCW